MSRITQYGSARFLRVVLLVVCATLIVGIGWIFATAQAFLQSKVESVNKLSVESQMLNDELSQLNILRSYLDQNTSIIERTSQIISESQQYKFQDQVINDLVNYASLSSITIRSYDFGPKPGQTVASQTASSLPQKTIVIIRVPDGTSVDNFLKFLTLIEKNKTKMQLTGLIISPSPKNPVILIESSIEIEVFLK